MAVYTHGDKTAQKTIACFIDAGGGANFNATINQLRTDSAWRRYVTECGPTESMVWVWVTGEGHPLSSPESFSWQAPNWGDPNKGWHTVKVAGRIVTVKGYMAHSHCGVDVIVPTHQRMMSGKQIVALAIGG